MNEKKFLSYLKQYHQWLVAVYNLLSPLWAMGNYTEVLEVHKALQKANKSINKLGLVPVSL